MLGFPWGSLFLSGQPNRMMKRMKHYNQHLYNEARNDCTYQRAPNPPEFAQPRLSRSNDSHPQREGINLGVFISVWLVLPRYEATNLGVLICIISPYSNGAVQIQVGLELAE